MTRIDLTPIGCVATDVAEIRESLLATLPPESRTAFGR
jgi:hypothetical protein